MAVLNSDGESEQRVTHVEYHSGYKGEVNHISKQCCYHYYYCYYCYCYYNDK